MARDGRLGGRFRHPPRRHFRPRCTQRHRRRNIVVVVVVAAAGRRGWRAHGLASKLRSSMWDLAGFLGENRRVAGICVTTALLAAGHSCVAPVLPMFAEEFGASAAQVGAT